MKNTELVFDGMGTGMGCEGRDGKREEFGRGTRWTGWKSELWGKT